MKKTIVNAFCNVVFIIICFINSSILSQTMYDPFILPDVDIGEIGSRTRVQVISPPDQEDILFLSTRGEGYLYEFIMSDSGFEPHLMGPGAEHQFIGDVCYFFGKEKANLKGDSLYPLTFKAIEGIGYVYLCGRGVVQFSEGNELLLGYQDGVEIWIQRTKDERQYVREGAAEALGWLSKTEYDIDKSIPALISMLEDSTEEVRRNAAEALGRIGDVRGIEALLNLTNKQNLENEKIRPVATQSLRLIKVKDAEDQLSKGVKTSLVTLSEFLHNDQAIVREAAAQSLSKGGINAVGFLIVGLEDDDVEVRMAVVESLGKIGDKSAIKALTKALYKEEDSQVKLLIEEAMAVIQK